MCVCVCVCVFQAIGSLSKLSHSKAGLDALFRSDLLNEIRRVMDAGDILELRFTEGPFVRHVTFNIELVGLGYD